MQLLCSKALVVTLMLMQAINASPQCEVALGERAASAGDLDRLAKLIPHSTLAPPTGQLKYVVLGLGTQNYTCTSGNAQEGPSAAGAVAALYDIGTKLSHDMAAELKISTISGLVLSLSEHPGAVTAALELLGYDDVIGHHFFQSRENISTPIFAFDSLSEVPYPTAEVTKIDAVDAPAFACPGLRGEGAVQWLHLQDRKNVSRGGIDTVYRVETAGGKAPVKCTDQNIAFTVPYAAQYWFFGP